MAIHADTVMVKVLPLTLVFAGVGELSLLELLPVLLLDEPPPDPVPLPYPVPFPVPFIAPVQPAESMSSMVVDGVGAEVVGVVVGASVAGDGETALSLLWPQAPASASAKSSGYAIFIGAERAASECNMLFGLEDGGGRFGNEHGGGGDRRQATCTWETSEQALPHAPARADVVARDPPKQNTSPTRMEGNSAPQVV